MTQRTTIFYAAAPFEEAERGKSYLHVGLQLPETRIGPPKSFIVSGEDALRRRTDLHSILIGRAFARLNAFDEVTA